MIPPSVTKEYSSIYDDRQDRYVVSLIVSYSEMALNEEIQTEYDGLDRYVSNEPNKMKAALAAAIDLTRDEGSSDTQWYVFDRKTKQGRFIEQGEVWRRDDTWMPE